MKTIGQRIRARRIELGMTQEELAKKLGYHSRSSINKIEKDGRDLRQKKIMDFANALSTTPAYIMGWNEPPTEANVLSDTERYLLLVFRQFNSTGQQKIFSYMEDLTASEKYKQPAPQDFHDSDC